MNIVEFKLDAGFHANFWLSVESLQKDHGIVAIDRLKRLPWSVLVMLPPKGTMFAAMDFPYRVRLGALEWQKAVDSKEVYFTFLKEFEERGVRKCDIPSSWIDYYGLFEKHANSVVGLGRFARRVDPQRMRSLIVPHAIEKDVCAILSSEEVDLEELAYIQAPGRISLSDWRAADRGGDASTASQYKRWPYWGMLGGIPQGLASSRVVADLKAEAIANLHRAIVSLEQGSLPDLPLDPVTLCQPPVFLGRRVTRGCSSEIDLDELAISLRARLLRLLRWPHVAKYVKAVLDGSDVDRATCEESDSFAYGLPLAGKLPFDPREELSAYLSEVEEKYHWLAEDPFAHFR